MLDPDIAQMMQAMQDNGEPPLFKDTTGEKARQRGVEIRARYYPPVLKHVARIEERSVPGQAGDLPVRVHWPENPTGATIVFFHGGGWIIGDLDSHDGHARRLAATVGAVVVHVEYRLAPENPFPAGYQDCIAATDWTYDHIDELGGRADRIALAGDSAGGNLAASVAVYCRDTGRELAGQLLIYPAVDLAAGLAVAGVESGGIDSSGIDSNIPIRTGSLSDRTTGSNGSTSPTISTWQLTRGCPPCTPTATPIWHQRSSASGITTRCWTKTSLTQRCWPPPRTHHSSRVPRSHPRLLRHGRRLRQRRTSRRPALPGPQDAAHRHLCQRPRRPFLANPNEAESIAKSQDGLDLLPRQPVTHPRTTFQALHPQGRRSPQQSANSFLKINAFGSDAPTGSVAAADRIPQAESQAQPMLPVAIGAVIFDDRSVMSS